MPREQFYYFKIIIILFDMFGSYLTQGCFRASSVGAPFMPSAFRHSGHQIHLCACVGLSPDKHARISGLKRAPSSDLDTDFGKTREGPLHLVFLKTDTLS